MFDEVPDIRFSIDFGSCFNIFGGWLECLLMYSGLLIADIYLISSPSNLSPVSTRMSLFIFFTTQIL